MLRPATPLTLLLIAAFALLLLSVLSTPIIKAIPLATFEGVDFGVFGYCKGDDCSGIRIGYSTDGLFGDSSADDDFNLPSSARHSLSSLLIVHPIAAFLSLVCACLAGAAHFHSPSHSSKYLLFLLILLLPTLLVSLLAFLVDVLLFVPHMSWGGWIVLAATIIILLDGILVCAMRRTLVSRKARKRRIAENAEMNGDNFYARQQLPKADSPPPIGTASGAPMVNGAPGANSLPAFATYDASRKSEEDRIPLNQQVSPSDRGLPSRGDSDGSERYGSSAVGSATRGYNGPRDEYGNPLPPGSAYPGPRQPPDPRMRDQYGGNPRMGPPGGRGGPMGPMRGGMMPPRGRGGYPPIRGGYGRGGPYGPYGPAGPARGPPPQNFNAPGGYNQGYGGQGYGGNGGRGVAIMGGAAAGAAAGLMAGGMGRGPQRGPPPGYNPSQSGMQPPPPGGYGAASSDNTIYTPYNAAQSSSSGGPQRQGSGDSAGPVGQAVELDESNGQLSPGLDANYNLRDSDADVQGMIGLQQNRQGIPQKPVRAASSVYSSPSAYVPPRAGWAGSNRNPSPLNTQQNVPPLPVSSSPIEMNATGPANASAVAHTRSPSHGSTDYYEDVDPRFVEASAQPEQSNMQNTNNTATIASSAVLMEMNDRRNPSPPRNNMGVSMPAADNDIDAGPSTPRMESYENLHEVGARSPAASEASHFTSISQRGINPQWRPGPGDMGMMPPGPQGAYLRPGQQAQRQRDVLLSDNPDFALPNAGRRGRGGGGPGMRGGMGMGMGMAGMGLGSANDGRYPVP